MLKIPEYIEKKVKKIKENSQIYRELIKKTDIQQDSSKMLKQACAAVPYRTEGAE